MENNKEEKKKYELLASYLDSRSACLEDGSVSKPEMEEDGFRKLVFLWDECRPEKTDTEDVWVKTLQKINGNRDTGKPCIYRRQRAFIPVWAWSVAASVILVASIIFFLKDEGNRDVQEMEQYMQANAPANEVKEVTLVVSDKREMQIADNSQVAYSATGQVQVNSEKLAEPDGESKEEEYNQIIVPKGRRSMIMLADNSKIWINSGTRVVYPRSFGKGKNRKIFVEGEVYLQVAHDKTRPFIVSTSSLDVEVLGTTFNVSAYKGGSVTSVVLVDGAVDVKDRLDRHIRMLPNERVELTEAGIMKKEKVNALDYTAWVNGVWILDGRPLKEVLRYLSEYYGAQVHCAPVVENEPIYGKLFLNDDLNKILETIRQALSATRDTKNDIIYTDDK
ncbi:MAG: FecR domain-containing protein [Prevotella sp.]|jgi:ferric-dicitrate binding protein FerR (iron transport regulator)|nr:FecR domain-containing protein [Prevotella sp.]